MDCIIGGGFTFMVGKALFTLAAAGVVLAALALFLGSLWAIGKFTR
jgi:hypothetical protein